MSMSWNRREFLTTSTLALAAGALRGVPLFGQQPATPVSFEELRNGVGIFIGRGGTIGWAITPDALIVVDTQFPDTAEQCLAGLKERSTRMVDILINTHHHGDHTGGNAVFRPAAKVIVAHQRVPELQRAQAEAAGTAAQQAYADVTFPDTWRQSVGRVTVSAKHYGPGHTGGDAVIYFEEANVVHMGDLMFNRRHPFVDRPSGAAISGWVSTLEGTVEDHSNDAIYIFGHAKDGLPITGDRSDLLFFRDYLSAALDHARKGIAAGQSKEQVTSLAALPRFEDFMEAPPRLTLAGVLGVAYDELTA